MLKKYFMGVLTFFILSGCSYKLSKNEIPKYPSETLLPKGKAPILKYFQNRDKKRGKKSAFYSLFMPTDAFAARLFLIDHATTSLDVQYYIFDYDRLGKIFASHLLKAAKRGVKIRFLLDDFNTGGKDKELRKLASHPNIDLHIFNPNKYRHLLRDVALVLDSTHLGKRMHNKSLIADGAVAIIGGRNIGDVYFASDDNTLFLDYDVLVVGEEVPKIDYAFNLFWNYKRSIPSKYIIGKNEKGDKAYEEELKKAEILFKNSTTGQAILNSDFNRKIAKNKLQLTVANRTHFYYDYPNKVDSHANDIRTHMSPKIKQNLKNLKKSLLLISPYFVPTNKTLKYIKSLRQKGIEVTIITNSLASTDVSIVYSGYKHFIKSLVQMGVTLYELKPRGLKKFLKTNKWSYHYNALSLHTKMMIIDDNKVGIGSANLDPRSNKLNTEVFMLIDSKKIVNQHKKRLSKIVNLKNLYRLSWNQSRGIGWKTIENGKEKMYYSPPHTGFWKMFAIDFVSLLPIDGYL